MGTGSLDRRQLLRGAGGLALLAGAGPLLAACGSGNVGNAEDNRKVTLPGYQPWTAVAPDLPPTADGVLAGYFRHPQQRKSGVTGKPGSGGEITALVNTFDPIPPTASRNTYWQELNARLGVTLNLNVVPDSTYMQKLAAVLAGGELPDIVQIRAEQPQLAGVLKAEFADLTEYLSGDAVLEYPFLANLPPYAWRPMVVAGAIRALPTPRAPVGSVMFCREDLIAARGLNRNPKNFAEFAELCVGLTDVKLNRWALGAGTNTVAYVMHMTGAPNNWRQEGGKFTHAYETEEVKQALAAVTSLVKKGVFHPDTFAGNADLRTWFGSGRIALNRDGYAAWDLLATTYQVPVGGLVAPKYDGGGDARHNTGQTTFAYTAFKKTGSRDRIRELLRICNWLAAPVGTEEHLFRTYGLEGTHFAWQNGTPVPTEQGKIETKLPLKYLVEAPPVLGPGDETRVRAQYAYQQRVVPHLQPDASVGLYSPTQTSKGIGLRKIIADTQNQILNGHQPLSAWDEAVKSWRQQGGDAIRSEYEADFAARTP